MFGSARRTSEGGEPPAAAPDVAGVLRASGLFDVDYYLEAYPDVAAAGVDPVGHYAEAGVSEARNPNPFFDSAWYLAANADVREAGLNPLHHYVTGGAAEGRSAGPDFDTAYYVARNPEASDSGLNPLLHYIRHGRAAGLLAAPYDEGDAFETADRARRQEMAGPAAALFTGARADHVHFPLTDRDASPPRGGLPLPPPRLARRVGWVTPENADGSGRDVYRTILRTLPEGWDWRGKRCLDFCSGVGATLRHFAVEAAEAEFWGCDADGSSVRWSMQNLSPPFRFFRIGEIPTLALEDGSFDLVIAVSVLSHVHATWDPWLMEIRRVLKPGGVFFATFLGPTPLAERLGKACDGRNLGLYVEGPFRHRDDGGPTAFASPEWLKTRWEAMFDIDYIALDGLMDGQSFVLARKPVPGAPVWQQASVLNLSTLQTFDPDAVGRIHPQVDLARPYRQSFGLDLSARSGVVVDGWAAFRGDVAERVEVAIDGRPTPAETTVVPGGPHRDWGSPVANFSARLDLTALAPGAHAFEARLRDRRGRTHALSIPLLIR